MEGTEVTLPHTVQIKRARSGTYSSNVLIDPRELAIVAIG